MRLGGCRKKRWAVALILLFFGLFLAQDWQEHGLFNDEAGRRSDCCRGNANSELSTIDVARFFFLPFFHSSSPAASQPCSQPLKPSRPLLTTLSLSRPLQAVLSTFGFHFIYSLTLIHTLTTLAGMKAFQAAGESDKSERARERGPRLLLLASFLPVFARSISLASLSLLLVFPPPTRFFFFCYCGTPLIAKKNEQTNVFFFDRLHCFEAILGLPDQRNRLHRLVMMYNYAGPLHARVWCQGHGRTTLNVLSVPGSGTARFLVCSPAKRASAACMLALLSAIAPGTATDSSFRSFIVFVFGQHVISFPRPGRVQGEENRLLLRAHPKKTTVAKFVKRTGMKCGVV